MFNSGKFLTLVTIILIVGLSIIPTMGVIGGKKYVPEHLAWKSNLGDDNDTTPPVTTHSLDPEDPDGENGFYISNVTITLNAMDDMSGVNTTYCYINGGPWVTYTDPFTVTSTRHYWINYYSVDNAGNVEDIKQVEFEIDKEPPRITLFYERLKKPLRYKFTAECHDYISGVGRVEFYIIPDNLTCIDYDKPYEWIMNFSSKGTGVTPYPSGPELAVLAVAYDQAGNSAEDMIEDISSNLISISGIICYPEFSEEEVTFFALMAISNYGGIHLFERLTFPNDYEGYIGRFLISAWFY